MDVLGAIRQGSRTAVYTQVDEWPGKRVVVFHTRYSLLELQDLISSPDLVHVNRHAITRRGLISRISQWAPGRFRAHVSWRKTPLGISRRRRKELLEITGGHFVPEVKITSESRTKDQFSVAINAA